MKNDFELNAIADSIFQELAKHTEPLEAITILGVTFLMMYERCDWKPRPTIEKFAQDVHDGLLTAWKCRTMPAPTSERMQ